MLHSQLHTSVRLSIVITPCDCVNRTACSQSLAQQTRSCQLQAFAVGLGHAVRPPQPAVIDKCIMINCNNNHSTHCTRHRDQRCSTCIDRQSRGAVRVRSRQHHSQTQGLRQPTPSLRQHREHATSNSTIKQLELPRTRSGNTSTRN